MKPVFISVDVEVTDTDPVHGRLMQVGMASSSGNELELVFGVSNSAKTSDWVRENLEELLQDCWRRRAGTRHLADIGVWEGGVLRQINAEFAGGVHTIMNWVLRERLNGHVEGQAVALPEISEIEKEAVMVCYCGGLDFGFLARAFAHCGLPNPFHYEFIEIGSLAMGKLGLPWGFPESELEKALGMDPMDPDIKHNALEDAKHQLIQFQRLLEIDQ